MHIVTKTYRDLPAAHRQHNHQGHCRLIHGHNWRVDICFTADTLDENGFVLDVGTLQWLKDWINSLFDHTLLLNEADPFLQHLQAQLDITGTPGFEEEGIQTVSTFAKIIAVPNCGMEGLAEYIFIRVSELLSDRLDQLEGDDRGLRIWGVTVWEDSKNRSNFKPSRP